MNGGETPGEELSALIDGALPEPRASELRRLIESDARLRAEFERLRRASDALRALPKLRAPGTLRQRVLKRPARLLRWLLPVAAALPLGVLLWWPDDAPADRKQTALAPDPDPPPPAAPAGEAAKDETSAAAGKPPSLLRAIEEGRPLADAAARAAYLAALRDLDLPALREHIVAAGARHASPPAELRLSVTSAAEAAEIRALLTRAFPLAQAAFGVAGEAESPMVFAIDPGEAPEKAVRSWVGLLDTGPKVRGRIASAKADVEGSGEAPRAPLIITLNFP